MFDVNTKLLTREIQRQRNHIKTRDKKWCPKFAQISIETESEFLSELNCGLTLEKSFDVNTKLPTREIQRQRRHIKGTQSL